MGDIINEVLPQGQLKECWWSEKTDPGPLLLQTAIVATGAGT